MVEAIPSNYPRLSPYLSVADAAAALAWYTTVLGAVERMRMPGPDGKVVHAEIEFGDSVLMLADEAPDIDFLSPKARGGSSVTLSLYIEDVDATLAAAQRGGATVTRPASDEFYGDRVAGFVDPFGHVWHIATHVKDVTAEEMAAYTAQS